MGAPLTHPRPVTPLGILAAKLQHLSRALDDIPEELAAELSEACTLASGLEPYLSRCTTPESPQLRALAQATAAEDWSRRSVEQEMLSGHVEGQLLGFLVAMTRSRRVLELGMFTGYSALAMSQALGEGGEVVACEVDPHVAGFALANLPAGHRVRVEIGPAETTLTRLAAGGERFDLVFVDADKSGYLAYVDTILDTDLLSPGGLICVDNTLMQGEPYLGGQLSANGAAIAAFNRAIAEDTRVDQVLLPLRDGLTLIRRR